MSCLTVPGLAELVALHHGRPDCAEALHDLLSDGGRVLFYRTEGVLRGYLVWRPGPQGAEVQTLYVAPGWRRRGISRRLLRRLAEITRD